MFYPVLSRHLRGLRAAIRPSLNYLFCRQALPLWILLAAGFLDVFIHSHTLNVSAPEQDWDEPFATECQNVTANSALPRENAAFVMLTRNSDLDAALHSVRSVERHFNKWFQYPVIFLNDEPWNEEFVTAMTNAVSGGKVQFEVIPKELWGYPDYIDKEAAQASIKAQGSLGKYSEDTKAGIESYHHMCRFYSGHFFNLEVLKSYKYYWRIEPDIDLYCDITYDPFAEMSKRGKLYGYAIAIQETAATCPSLFHHVLKYRELRQIPTTDGWKSIMSPSWLPWPFRAMTSSWNTHDRQGDIWNRCHYWSNFEIANLEFFRSEEYQDFYRYLDSKGGFYFERWGDAPIHSLAVSMLMDPRKVHNFQDIGYRHDWLFQCPANAPGGQLPESDLQDHQPYAPEMRGGIGCHCECDGRKPRNYPQYCEKKLAAANTRAVSFWADVF